MEQGELSSNLEAMNLKIALLEQQLVLTLNQKEHYKRMVRTKEQQILKLEANAVSDQLDLEAVLADQAKKDEMISQLQGQCQDALRDRDEAAAKFAAERLSNVDEKIATMQLISAIKESNVNLISEATAANERACKAEERAQQLEEQVCWFQDAVQYNAAT